MDTTSTHDERQFSIGAANMPVPYHLDESDSDSIVSAIFFSSGYISPVLISLFGGVQKFKMQIYDKPTRRESTRALK